MRRVTAGVKTANIWLCLLPLLACMALAVEPAAGASVVVSPLNGTPDASPYTQISFLGVPANQISGVSVVGSRTGRHGGQLRAYATLPGASLLPTHQFSQGERVSVTALIGPRGNTRRVGSTFYVAQLSSYTPPPSGSPAPAKAGTMQSFLSQPTLHPPNIAVTINSTQAVSAGDIFITPTHGLGQSGPMIINGQGGLVWYAPLPTGQVAADFQVESYKGQPVLVWWQGHIPEALGVGLGEDEIYNTAYQHIATVAAGNGYEADLHDIQLTPQGSAFITAYSLIDADLSTVGGSRNGPLQDSLVQEIDVPTGLVMFEWHAYGHVELGDSYTHPPSSAAPWDFFHINSISTDPWGDGNFIISSRNTWAAYEIDHFNGAIQWRLGGKHSSFKMGPGTGTAYQHDVRWQPDHTLTIFDNGAVPKAHSQTRIIRERIDWPRRKVTLVSRFLRSPGLLAGSQGDDQVLPNGDSFVGWGEDPYFTEFSPTGQMLFDAHMPVPGQSYRAFRFPWSATPAAAPSIAVKAQSGMATIYASWNGATTVNAWRVLSGPATTGLQPIITAPVAGFETAITVQSPNRYFAVQALGDSGQVLASSPVR